MHNDDESASPSFEGSVDPQLQARLYAIGRISKYSAFLAKKCGLLREEVQNILYASPMHDVGKIGIPDIILPYPTDVACSIIQRDAGKAFDPELVELFLANIDGIVEIKESLGEGNKPAPAKYTLSERDREVPPS